MSKKYYLEIKIFIKQDADILPNHRSKNHEIELFKGKQVLLCGITNHCWNKKLMQ